MLPLSDSFWMVFKISSFFAMSSLSFWAAKSYRFFAAIPLVVFVAIAVKMYRDLTGAEYEGLGYILILATLVVAMFLAVGWVVIAGLVLKRAVDKAINLLGPISAGIVSAFVAISPALLFVAFSLNSQYVPDGPCSNSGVTFLVGEQSYFVPREFQPRLEIETAGSNKRKIFRFSDRTRDKENTRQICNLTRGGEIPLDIGLLWITPASVFQKLEIACNNKRGPKRAYCSNYSASVSQAFEITHTIKITEYAGDLLPYHLGWLESSQPNVKSEGNSRDGYVCWGGDAEGERVNCAVWHTIDTSSMVFASTIDVADQSGTEVRALLEQAVQFTLKELSQ